MKDNDRLRLEAIQQFAAQHRIAEETVLERRAMQEVDSIEQSVVKEQNRNSFLQQVANAQRQIDKQRLTEQGKQKVERSSVQKVWKTLDGHEFRSPLEALFWDAWPRETIPLVPQHPIRRYHVDFAHLASKTVIEIDGYAYHSSKRAFVNDRERELDIQAQGWHVIRFSSIRIAQDVAGCVAYVLNRIQQSR